MDISHTLAPTSDQLDAVDLLGGPRTFVIERVDEGSAEQPVNIHLVGFSRPWRPGKSMRRVLAACWGTDGSVFAGRKVRLYCDPTVTFGKERTGGTRISHLSHIDRLIEVPLLISRGKSQIYRVEPLADEPSVPAGPTAEQVAGCASVDELRGMWHAADDEVRALITARVAELSSEATS